ncbi:MAG: hypothetical protein IT270_07670 [Saprospiraceae bacterium]|nr:hypothetical protein [Saprospiraceae bacterium]
MIGSAVQGYSQVEQLPAHEVLENHFRETDIPAESDAPSLLEDVEHFQNHPLNLNTVARSELLALRLFDALKVEQLVQYRETFGPFLADEELQAIPGWDLSDVRLLLQVARVPGSGLNNRVTPWRQGFREGDNDLMMRWGRASPVPYPSGAEGGPNAMAVRFTHQFDRRLRFGFTAEKDPGEAFFAKSNPQGFDFYSGHLGGQNPNRWITSFALGDFTARFGQGLLLQTGFAPGKSAETMGLVRGGRKISSYNAFGEVYFLRGGAITVVLGNHWELTALASRRRRDANVIVLNDTLLGLERPELAFSALQTAGLHRTPSETADEKALKESLGGLSVSRIWKHGQVGLNTLYLGYDKPWQRSQEVYRSFTFSGKQLWGLSIDYQWSVRNMVLFGETSRSDNGAVASVNGILLSLDRRLNLALYQRSLPRHYQALYAAPVAEINGAANEKGVYLGGDLRFARSWVINAYADLWRHPWLRYGVSSPSSGYEYLLRLQWLKGKTFSTYLLWQLEQKQLDGNDDGVKELVNNNKSRLRLHAVYRVSRAVEFRSRVEWTWYQTGRQATARGFLAYQEAVVKPLGAPISGAIRFCLFDTESFDTRVFAYENDLFSAVSIPAFFGQGTRYFLNLSWRVNVWLRLEARFEETVQRKVVTDSGTTGASRYWKIQARIRW